MPFLESAQYTHKGLTFEAPEYFVVGQREANMPVWYSVNSNWESDLKMGCWSLQLLAPTTDSDLPIQLVNKHAHS